MQREGGERWKWVLARGLKWVGGDPFRGSTLLFYIIKYAFLDKNTRFIKTRIFRVLISIREKYACFI